MGALKAGAEYAAEHLPKQDPFSVERMHKTDGQILVEGNAAGALGAMFAGVTVVAWYPITPSSSLPEALIGYMKKYRIDKTTGKATYAIVQAEDEIAAIGMVVGAGWAGARAMTSTSGPGISLMSEFAGLAYYAEVPGVVFDIQRVGPSTGLPTRTAQGDISAAALLSHGDTRQILLIPSSVEECYEMAMDAFDLAERLQTLVFVMSDLDLGHEHVDGASVRVSRQAARPRQGARRGDAQEADGASGAATRTWTATGFPYRTLPGTGMPSYFTRGSGHNERGQYSERPDDYQKNVDRLARKLETAKTIRAGADRRGRGSGDRHHRLRLEPLGRSVESRGAARGGGGHQDRLPADPRVSVPGRGRGVHRALPAHLRRRAEPRRADAAC